MKNEHLTNEEDFLIKINKQNLPGSLKNDIKLLRKYNSAKNTINMYNVILEINPDTYNYISRKDKIYVGWDGYKYFDFVSVVRYFLLDNWSLCWEMH